MEDNKKDSMDRRSLLAGIGVAAVGAAAGSTTANAQSTEFKPTRHDEDSWFDELPGSHRVFLDSSSPAGGAVALLYANNILNAHIRAYNGGESDYAMVVCFRHNSTQFGFNDDIWEKYGEGINSIASFPDPETGEAPQLNLMQATGRSGLPNGGNTIDSLGSRGVKFAICDNTATVMSRGLARAGFGDASEIYLELKASAVSNSRFVSAGVIAATRAQEYGYSLLFCDG